MEWPLYFRDELVIGNVKKNIGICTLWMKKEIVKKLLSTNLYSVIGNLYTTYGLNYLVRNILANPRIRYIILLGPDLTGSGEALIKLIQHGVEEDGKIKGTKIYIDRNISLRLLEIFRRNVKVVDMRGKNVHSKGLMSLKV